VPQLKEIRVAPLFASSLTYDWQRLVELFSVETGISFIVEPEDHGLDFGDWKHDSTDSSRSSDEVDLYSDDD